MAAAGTASGSKQQVVADSEAKAWQLQMELKHKHLAGLVNEIFFTDAASDANSGSAKPRRRSRVPV